MSTYKQRDGFNDYLAYRQMLVNAGQPGHKGIEVKHMAYAAVQANASKPKSGVSLSANGPSYHDVYYTTADGPTKAYFTFDGGVMAINGVKDAASIGQQNANQPKRETNFVDVQFNLESDPTRQTDEKAMAFVNGYCIFDADVEQTIKDNINSGQVATNTHKISTGVQTTYSFKSTVTIEDKVTKQTVSAAGRKMEHPIPRLSIKLAKKYDPTSKIPVTRIYDVRESAKNVNPATGEVKWVEATWKGEKINGNNWKDYITFASKVWMMKCSYQVNQSNFGISGSMDVWDIAIEHVPVSNEAKSTIPAALMSRFSQLATTEPVVVQQVDEHNNDPDPLAGAMVGQLSTGQSANQIMNNIAAVSANSQPAIDMSQSTQAFLQQMQAPPQVQMQQPPQVQMQAPPQVQYAQQPQYNPMQAQMQPQQVQMQPQQYAQMQAPNQYMQAPGQQYYQQ